ncbi:hypothetical protein EYF80_023943 [Liparis tanakae]|uniref:Uncharacterized protein n=1 Tax=Liparis tanakae TaxID=230148 RepID=A0A4Z2HJL5_9TELE|nr:hypothetical protein EYF80_023943 [Liparis tanakae]
MSRRGVFIERSPLSVVRNPNITHKPVPVLIGASRPQPVSSSRPVPISPWHTVHCVAATAADRNMSDAYATFRCPWADTSGDTESTPGDPLGVGGRVFGMERQAKRCMGQDLDYNTSPAPCLGSLGLGGGQGSRRQPLDSALRERSLGLLTQWHYLSSSLGYCSSEHFLSLCKHFLSLA